MNTEDQGEYNFFTEQSEQEELSDMLKWSYSKLHLYSFSNQDDVLMLDRIKLYLTGAW